LVDEDSTKRTLSSLFTTLAQRGIDVKTLKDNIALTCSRTMQVFSPMLKDKISAFSNNKGVQGTPF